MSVIPHYLESYKSAYSHPGLEAMYALETVDIKTIRLLKNQTNERVSSKPLEIEKLSIDLEESNQLEFNFDGELSPGIKPLVLEEPIQVLHLSSHIEKILFSYHKNVLGDLLSINPYEWVFVKGIGQGHLDEIKTKLNDYLKNHHLRLSRQIDFACLVRILVGSIKRIDAALVLDQFDLSHLILLTHAEKMEMRRLNAEEKLKLYEINVKDLKRSKSVRTLEKIGEEICQVLIKPWMHRRGGLATDLELMERIERLSKAPSLTPSILKFISQTFLEGRSLFNPYLMEVDKNLYSPDRKTAVSYQTVVQKALAYFYRPSAAYPFQQLAALLQKDFALSWVEFSDEFIKKSLELAPHFQVNKDGSGLLMIQLNQCFRKPLIA